MRTAPFLFISNMAMLPESARRAAAYLGGGIARGIEQKGAQVAQAGKNIIKNTAREVPMGSASVGTGGQKVAFAGLQKDPIGGRVGQFLENIGGQMQQFGSSVGTEGGMKKRDVGLAAAGLGMGAAFVGGMGANAGVNALMGYHSQNSMLRPRETAAYGSGPMPSDLQTGYVSLNQFGSPLGIMNLRHEGNVQRAKYNQMLMLGTQGPQYNVGMGENNG